MVIATTTIIKDLEINVSIKSYIVEPTEEELGNLNGNRLRLPKEKLVKRKGMRAIEKRYKRGKKPSTKESQP